MKFRAELTDVNLLTTVVNAVDKIGKQCVMHLHHKKIALIYRTDVQDGVQVWTGISTASILQDVVLQSMNDNNIAFEISLENLQRALKSGQHSPSVQARLTKKGGFPYLTFIIKSHSLSGNVTSLIQDVPIQLLSSQSLSELMEPKMPPPDVHIMLPKLKALRPVIEKMKSIGDFLQIEANWNGTLIFSVETDTVRIRTTFKDLDHPQMRDQTGPMPSPDANRSVKIKVDVKKFCRVLTSFNTHETTSTVVACFNKNKAVVLHVMLEDRYLSYYIPVHMVPD